MQGRGPRSGSPLDTKAGTLSPPSPHPGHVLSNTVRPFRDDPPIQPQTATLGLPLLRTLEVPLVGCGFFELKFNGFQKTPSWVWVNALPEGGCREEKPLFLDLRTAISSLIHPPRVSQSGPVRPAGAKRICEGPRGRQQQRDGVAVTCDVFKGLCVSRPGCSQGRVHRGH